MALKQSHTGLRSRLRRVTNLHYVFMLAVAGQIVLFDSGKFIPPAVVLYRSIALGALAVAVTFVWYMCRNRSGQESTLNKLLALLIVADISFASFMVYSQRGMASKAAMLYFIPIIVSAIAVRKSAILATTALCTITYITTCIAYFVLNFNEGYKLELYGETAFYSICFVIAGMLLWVAVRPKDPVK